jgi:dolichol-phosphate mannosyltransferase
VVARGAGFATVGLTGLLVNSGLMWLAVGSGIFSMSYLVAAVIATQGSSTWNFTLVDRFVYAGPKRSTALRRWTGFLAMSNLVLLLRIPMLALLVGGLGMHYLVANALTLLVGFFARFSGQERLSLQRR